ncbi:DUF4145 domain-containing protein [Aliarcobacter cryaerophilus]|uniref:DUF4145 domain-containing protein n=1 Tax=Aliarcobacter cryaerophilus TaxID=28198 RepID=UPI003AF371AE
MAEIIYDCPRCGVKKTSFDINGQNFIEKEGWKDVLELYSICRHCNRGTIFIVKQNNVNISIKDLIGRTGNVNRLIEILRYVNIRENSTDKPPEFLPDDINEVFEEGIICKSVECFNASATMFRLCLDKATKELLPNENENGLSEKIKRSLGLRLKWLIDNNYINKSLEDLTNCIKDDGNDGAHEGILNKEDLEDLYEFTFILLERLYTEPKKIEMAKERRLNRHKK